MTGVQTCALPIFLASGINGNVLFNDNNNIGQSLNFTFNKTLDILGVSGAFELRNRSHSVEIVNGATVPSGIAQLDAYSLGGRPTLGVLGSGTQIPTFLQPSLFNRFIFIANTSTGTTIGTYGNTLTSVGTVSHPTPTIGSGYMVNQVTGATAGNTAGTGSNINLFSRSSISGLNTGFFFATRMTLPDIAYDGLRVFCGLTTASMATQVGSDNPAADYAGFFFSTTRATDDKFWQFSTKDNTTQTLQSTNVTCSGNILYDMYIYSPPFPNNGAIYWTIKNVSNGQEVNGYQAANLPRTTQTMKPGIQMSNVVAAAKNIRFTSIYCEAL